MIAIVAIKKYSSDEISLNCLSRQCWCSSNPYSVWCKCGAKHDALSRCQERYFAYTTPLDVFFFIRFSSIIGTGYESVVRALVGHGVNVNTKVGTEVDRLESTPLHGAAAEGKSYTENVHFSMKSLSRYLFRPWESGSCAYRTWCPSGCWKQKQNDTTSCRR